MPVAISHSERARSFDGDRVFGPHMLQQCIQREDPFVLGAFVKRVHGRSSEILFLFYRELSPVSPVSPVLIAVLSLNQVN